MANEKPESISVSELSNKIKAAIAEASKQDAALGNLRSRVVFGPGVVGYVLNEEAAKRSGRELHTLAIDLTKKIRGTATPVVLISGGGVTVGFRPPEDLT